MPRYQPADSSLSPRFVGVPTFARLPLVDTLEDVDVAVVGVPFDTGVTFRVGGRFGPNAVRAASLLLRPYNPSLDVKPFEHLSCIDGGDMRAAAEALGRPHRVEGVVVRGDQRGRELGFPTANLALPQFTAIPADGVYAAWFVHGKRELPAAVSIGTNPTFSGRQRTVEAYVLDIDEDFYGHRVGLDFVSRLRGQVRFDGIPALVEQMTRDVAQVREVLSEQP